MKRNNTFTFRINSDERLNIARLAQYLNRSQSDAIRFLVLNAVRELEYTTIDQRFLHEKPKEVNHV